MKGYKSFLIFLIFIALVYGRRVRNPCEDGKIPCDNGQCIDRFDWCFGGNQCTDQSDEKYCRGHVSCTEMHFTCGDGMCLPASLRCDDEHDCFDGSDERNCETIDQDDSIHPKGREQDHSSTDDLHVPNPVSNSNYNPRYPERNNRGSDSFPEGNFPDNQQPQTPGTPSQRRPQGPPPSTGNRQDPPRPDYHYAGRETPVVQPPRSILYPPRTTLTISPRRNARRPNYSSFYFARNYTENLRRDYRTNIRKAKDWLLGQRDGSYGWGRDTPRGLISLSLISNSFQSDVEDNELMRKSLQTHLGVKILRNETGIEKMSTTRLAVYINALLATCQDPRDFWGIDLANILHDSQNQLEQDQRFINPLIYLSLCLTDMPVNVRYLQQFLSSSFPTEISKDLHILATAAMACVAQRNPHDSSIRYKLDEAAQNLLTQMNQTNGSFGSKYSTALAAQVLMSVNTSLRWDPQKTLDYLVRQQTDDGSFGNMQATYYAVLALSGRSLVHLRNTLCDPVDFDDEGLIIEEGPRKTIFYTLRIGYPETFTSGIQLSVPVRMNFFDIMRVAARQDPRFKFNYEISQGHYSVHTIANIPNDPERGMFWTLYRLPSSSRAVDLRRRYTEDINQLVPEDEDEVIFWYLSEF